MGDESILSSFVAIAEKRIEGCGLNGDVLQTRTLRYGLRPTLRRAQDTAQDASSYPDNRSLICTAVYYYDAERGSVRRTSPNGNPAGKKKRGRKRMRAGGLCAPP
jgi:hypothetical protein